MSNLPEIRRQGLSVSKATDRDELRTEKASKIAVSIRLDADIIEYFKSQGPGWQSRMNADLRETMVRDQRDDSHEAFLLSGHDHPFIRHFTETSVPVRLSGLLPQGCLTIPRR